MKHLLSSSAFLVVNKTLAKNIGLKETILLADLISKEEYFINNGMTDGWFFNTEANIQKDTTLTPYQQRNALKSLKNNQIIETIRKGIPAKQFFKINEEQVIKFLNNKSSTNLTTINKNKEITLNNKLSIKEKFINQVMYFDYPKEMKEDFISYWTEGVKKMRFQKQGTFEIKLRLKRWSKNSAKWDKPKSKVSSKLDSQLNELVKAKNYL
jgi:hypothetical protein